jgi:uridine kinase
MPSPTTCKIAAESRPQLIAIAGPSCGGKTTLARALAQVLPGAVLILPLDAYYRDRSHLSAEQRATVNFDAPAALDAALLQKHISALANGHAIERPNYDFVTHSRMNDTATVQPDRFMLIEGLFALYWPELNSLYHTRIFVEADSDLCLQRRLQRDVRERGRSPHSVRQQFRQQVEPMYAHHVYPTRQRAQLHLHGGKDLQQLVRTALAHIDRVR